MRTEAALMGTCKTAKMQVLTTRPQMPSHLGSVCKMVEWACTEGRRDVLKWLMSKLKDSLCRKFGRRVCILSARHGHLRVLQWARENGCPWDED
eukprot:scaffold151947_cov31-Tisochrysis_lutea.AAC.1